MMSQPAVCWDSHCTCVRGTVYSVRLTRLSVQCTVYSVQCTVYSLHCRCVQCTVLGTWDMGSLTNMHREGWWLYWLSRGAASTLQWHLGHISAAQSGSSWPYNCRRLSQAHLLIGLQTHCKTVLYRVIWVLLLFTTKLKLTLVFFS